MSLDRLASFLNTGSPVVRVQLTSVQGSSPREAGAEMFVTEAGIAGTIGGGRLEHLAIEEARALLAAGDLVKELDIPLGPEIGQCCGGRVSLNLTRMRDAERANVLKQAEIERTAQPHVYILGGGHVGRALANLFQHLPLHTVIVDQREAELALCEASVEKRLSAMPEAVITAAPVDSAFIVLTHDHALDFLLAAAAIERGDAAYAGLIGSATKRARFERWFRQEYGSESTDALICPIGKSEGRDKRPEIIAAFVVAEVVATLAKHASAQPQQHSENQPSIVTEEKPIKTRKSVSQRGETGR